MLNFFWWSWAYWGVVLVVAVSLFFWHFGPRGTSLLGEELVYSGSPEEFVMNIAGSGNYAAIFLIAMLAALVGASFLFPRRPLPGLAVERNPRPHDSAIR